MQEDTQVRSPQEALKAAAICFFLLAGSGCVSARVTIQECQLNPRNGKPMVTALISDHDTGPSWVRATARFWADRGVDTWKTSGTAEVFVASDEETSVTIYADEALEYGTTMDAKLHCSVDLDS